MLSIKYVLEKDGEEYTEVFESYANSEVFFEMSDEFTIVQWVDFDELGFIAGGEGLTVLESLHRHFN